MTQRLFLLAIVGVLTMAANLFAQPPGNLLRNARFQDDWLTLLPENKNHNWNYAMEFYDRRDFNPDAWDPRGSWEWLDADAPPGKRRLVVKGPDAKLSQSVNWCAVHDPRFREGFPDAGGYPKLVSTSSKHPQRWLRDLTLRVTFKGTDVPEQAGGITLAWVGGDKKSKPVAVSASWPAGASKTDKIIEVVLPAAAWLGDFKDQKDVPLPDMAQVTLHYTGKTGEVDLIQAALTTSPSQSSNLLANGGFDLLDKDAYPQGWSRPEKYRYFPPAYYYIFNTWHNAGFDNRGLARADSLVAAGGRQSMQMIVPAGDEAAVTSAPIALNQKEPRLLEVWALVKTDKLCMLQIDALDETGQRLDAYNFIQKAPYSIGSDDWRLLRQVFRPRTPVKALRLQLCGRGVNGYTLGGVAPQPQSNVVGTLWWDNVRVYEPDSTAEELRARGVTVHPEPDGLRTSLTLQGLDLGERKLGSNLLRATLTPPQPPGRWTLEWEIISPSGMKTEFYRVEQLGGPATSMTIPYTLKEPCSAYGEYRGTLRLRDPQGKLHGELPLWFTTWSTPMLLALGSTYLEPEQKQFIRLNLGLSQDTLRSAKSVRLDVLRKATGAVLHTKEIPATLETIHLQRAKIPSELRDDFANLLLTDLDVSYLPVQPFNDPQRNWLVRATLVDTAGNPLASVDSIAFCRQAHEGKQPPVQKVTIDKDNLLYVNGQPWMPWGLCYGHNPVYAGPADPGPGKYHNLHKGLSWNLYDRHVGAFSRAKLDLNSTRQLPGTLPIKKLEDLFWHKENVYAASAFYSVGFSLPEYFKNGGGKDKTDAWLAEAKASPVVVSIAPGVEEAFAHFVPASPAQLSGLKEVVDYIRKATDKPVMIGHGGYWNRFEFEKIPFFDIFDPETEPLYPAPLHVELMPLIKGQAKTVWLRPQMYENVPYERWRYHVWVELMRGARGWQIAHGPADASLFRGLHGEMEFIKPIAFSKEPGPKIAIEPWVEHWSRRHQGKTYLVAATTHGLTMGKWRQGEAGPTGKTRATGRPHEWRQEDNGYGLGQDLFQGPSVHSIQWLPDARSWPKGTRVVQWVRVDPKALPKNVVLLARVDGRWTHAASWGKFDAAQYHKDLGNAHWFLRAMYRHASGFIGWDDKLTGKVLEYVLAKATPMGELPKAGEWIKLEVPVEVIGAEGKLLDGIGFLHEDGRVDWGQTSLLDPLNQEHIVWGDTIGPSPELLAKTKINVAGLKAGAKVRVLFEDREIIAADGFFVDDFRGQDLYQRHGGGPYGGYGDTPVALHVYEIPW